MHEPHARLRRGRGADRLSQLGSISEGGTNRWAVPTSAIGSTGRARRPSFARASEGSPGRARRSFSEGGRAESASGPDGPAVRPYLRQSSDDAARCFSQRRDGAGPTEVRVRSGVAPPPKRECARRRSVRPGRASLRWVTISSRGFARVPRGHAARAGRRRPREFPNVFGGRPRPNRPTGAVSSKSRVGFDRCAGVDPEVHGR